MPHPDNTLNAPSKSAASRSLRDPSNRVPDSMGTVTPSLAAEPPYPEFAERAFARATGSEPIAGNSVQLLLDAKENYPAWLAAIRDAQRSILFESYIFDDDAVGLEFAEALAAKARAGVSVRVVCDWLGTRRVGSLRTILTEAGAEFRVFNPPRPDSPLGWLSRNHRKTIAVDGKIGYVSGLCARRLQSTGRSVTCQACASARSGLAIPSAVWSRGATRALKSAVLLLPI
jgi:phosphatidylserine/phosphatidylglycerophosphate/cardiolipin synthase-like enzyme